jgi:hypothetical protein
MNNGTTTQSNRSRWRDTYPHLGTDPLPADVFTSAEQFERERERIFKTVWLNVGRVEQIPHPGSYFITTFVHCVTTKSDHTRLEQATPGAEAPGSTHKGD